VVSALDHRPQGRGFESAGCGLSSSNRGPGRYVWRCLVRAMYLSIFVVAMSTWDAISSVWPLRSTFKLLLNVSLRSYMYLTVSAFASQTVWMLAAEDGSEASYTCLTNSVFIHVRRSIEEVQALRCRLKTWSTIVKDHTLKGHVRNGCLLSSVYK